MKMYSKLVVAGVVTMISLGFVNSSYAHKAGGAGINSERMAKQLNLSQDQRTQISDIVNDSKSAMVELRKSMRKNRKQLREVRQERAVNEEKVRDIAEALGDLKTEMIVLRSQRRSRIRSVLTDDQYAIMQDMRQKRCLNRCIKR